MAAGYSSNNIFFLSKTVFIIPVYEHTFKLQTMATILLLQYYLFLLQHTCIRNKGLRLLCYLSKSISFRSQTVFMISFAYLYSNEHNVPTNLFIKEYLCARIDRIYNFISAYSSSKKQITMTALFNKENFLSFKSRMYYCRVAYVYSE